MEISNLSFAIEVHDRLKGGKFVLSLDYDHDSNLIKGKQDSKNGGERNTSNYNHSFCVLMIRDDDDYQGFSTQLSQ
jgi:hypothetical protein